MALAISTENTEIYWQKKKIKERNHSFYFYGHKGEIGRRLALYRLK